MVAKATKPAKADVKVGKVDTDSNVGGVINNIQDKLEKKLEDNKKVADTGEARQQQAQEFDVSKLSDAQLRMLQAKLSQTSITNSKKTDQATVEVKIYNDVLVTDIIGNAFTVRKENPLTNIKEDIISIKITQLGAEEVLVVPYVELMQSPRVKVLFS